MNDQYVLLIMMFIVFAGFVTWGLIAKHNEMKQAEEDIL